jgi:DNA repair photolyase
MSFSEPAPYRALGLVRQCKETHEFEEDDPSNYRAIEAVPEFAARWAREAAAVFGNKNILTATVNSSGACPIGAQALCGQYCFAHRTWSDALSPRHNVARDYAGDAARLKEAGKAVGIFMSYDTEPFPGGEVSRISQDLLKAMIANPPAALLIHSHTAGIGDPDVVALLRDLSALTPVIAGIGFETDSDNVGANNRPHHDTVKTRFVAFEALSRAGVKTQASTTPLLGFVDFRAFVRSFHDAGAHRVMTGELRKEFLVGGSSRAQGLDLGLPIPTQDEALAICREFNFPGGVDVRENFYVAMT